MIVNAIINKLPNHLKTFIIDQEYSRYSPQNQAVWRYVMRQNINDLGKTAHRFYLDGLKKTGISIHHIPDMEEMNRILQNMGWAALTVDGFIPPAAFMEFQKHKALVIGACTIWPLAKKSFRFSARRPRRKALECNILPRKKKHIF